MQTFEILILSEKNTRLLFVITFSRFFKNREEIFTTIRKMFDGLIPQGVVYFTVFGPRDEWVGNKDMTFLEYEDILKFINDLPLKIYHRSTEEGNGKKMDGTIKYWHIHRFFCIKK